mmetsp:Transcript_68693/g.180122  ORF Transcript_68693/g.180122 Transcript_68693/m.180122 type:complete len:337 (-) Transcript_68693:246-1256(-)
MRHRYRSVQRAFQHRAAAAALPLLRAGRGDDSRGGHDRRPGCRRAAHLPAAGGQGGQVLGEDDRRQAREDMLRRALLPLLRERVPRQDARTAAAGRGRERQDAAKVPHGRGRVEPRSGPRRLEHLREHVPGGGLPPDGSSSARGLPERVARPLLLELEGAGLHGLELPAGPPEGPLLRPAAPAPVLGRPQVRLRGPAGRAAPPLAPGAPRLLRRLHVPARLPRGVPRRLRGERRRAGAGRQGRQVAPDHVLPACGEGQGERAGDKVGRAGRRQGDFADRHPEEAPQARGVPLQARGATRRRRELEGLQWPLPRRLAGLPQSRAQQRAAVGEVCGAH